MARTAGTNVPLSTNNLEIQHMQVLDLTDPMTPMSRDQIESVERSAIPKDHADRLAFMEEPIVIRLEATSERNPQRVVFVGVNGDKRWIPVGTPVRIRRKHAEVLARAQPYSVATDVGTAMEERPHNRVVRTTNRRHPFTVLEDKSPFAASWLHKVTFEG